MTERSSLKNAQHLLPDRLLLGGFHSLWMCQSADNKTVSKAAYFGATLGFTGENQTVHSAGIFLCITVQLCVKSPQLCVAPVNDSHFLNFK